MTQLYEHRMYANHRTGRRSVKVNSYLSGVYSALLSRSAFLKNTKFGAKVFCLLYYACQVKTVDTTVDTKENWVSHSDSPFSNSGTVLTKTLSLYIDSFNIKG